ncbi:aspartate/glutamate racemase family protein [Corynebacterium comes]|uniref:Amino-acid racemase n=1 Tax=Corynebacterium comes TaxID=2675218 RepID=A0A6B8VWU4_9CORY|nr:amino acid racemase [Corynebacterium comes]QGU03435.1 putative amino-acid racemase [Corynebacterium comes]
MKKLGLIGGTGPESTLIYYRRLHESVQKAAGETVIPPMTIENLSAFRVFEYLEQGDVEKLHDYLLAGINSLAAAGAEFAALSANTTHIVFDRLRESSPLPLISSIDSTRRAVAESGARSVALLGTRFTMVNDFLAGPLRQDGVHVAIPDDEEIAYIQEKIATELELGAVKAETRAGFLRIIDRLIADDAVELVILACTELPILFPPGTLPVPGLDTIDPHVEDLTREILRR